MQYAGAFRSAVNDQLMYFHRPAGFSSFTVHRSRNGGTWTAFTTPTITEETFSLDESIYKLLLDEDMTIGAGNITEVMALRIAASGMETVYPWILIYVDDVSHVLGAALSVGGSAPASPIGV